MNALYHNPTTFQKYCDFCTEPAPVVLRVALDEDYNRLSEKHLVKYACPSCSALKDNERTGRTRRPYGTYR